tara:strand:- start:70363 stop:70596 length:234 start_codon:yes stop_codon:yes gene_type:complete
MSKELRILKKILSGNSDANIRFDEVCFFLKKEGFIERISGSHHIFVKENAASLINLQKDKDGKAKPYQIKQIRKLLK